MITHNYELDMTPVDEPSEIHLNKNDTDFVLKFLLYSSVGTLKIESGTTAQIQGRKPNGDEYTASAVLDNETSTVTVTGNAALTNEAGTGIYEICLTHNGKKLYSANFRIVIEQIPL